MCGIVYVKRKDGRPAYKTVLKRYRAQKARGTDGYGYVAVKDNKIVNYRRAVTEHEIVKLLEKEDAPEILFHHRNPTSTPNVEEEAHPLLIENAILDHQYLVAHNGVIRNDEELKKKHNDMGIVYSTEMTRGFIVESTRKVYRDEHKDTEWNDSEALAVETALALDGKKKTIDTEGWAAVIGFQTKGKDIVERFFYRNGNPLKFHEDKTLISITSIGHGKLLDDTHVFKLLNGGGYTRFNDVATPPTYKTTHHAGHGSANNTTRVWNPEKFQWEDRVTTDIVSVPPPHVKNLPLLLNESRKKGLGFLPNREDFELDGRYNPDFPDSLNVRTPETVLKEVADMFNKNVGAVKTISLIERMPFDVLQREYDNATNAEILFQDIMEEFEGFAHNAFDDIAPELFDMWVEVEKRLKGLKEYIENLSATISVRDLQIKDAMSK